MIAGIIGMMQLSRNEKAGTAMSYDIEFDYREAESVQKAIAKYKEGIVASTLKLAGEINGMKHWWKGDSYEAFREKNSTLIGTKSTLMKLPGQADSIRGYLSNLADTKKDLEKRQTGFFK